MKTCDCHPLPHLEQAHVTLERPTFNETPRRRRRRRYPPAGTILNVVVPASVPPQGGGTEGAPSMPFLSQRELERLVLDALQARYPLITTAREVASKAELPYAHAQRILAELALRGTIETPRKGYYRHRPAPGGGSHE